MEQTTEQALRQALDYLKTGNTLAAQPILVALLKKDANLEQAWYMLSFTMPNLDKQIYALEQVLRIDPTHEKAASRLEKLNASSIEINQRLGQIQPVSENIGSTISAPETASGDDSDAAAIQGEDSVFPSASENADDSTGEFRKRKRFSFTSNKKNLLRRMAFIIAGSIAFISIVILGRNLMPSSDENARATRTPTIYATSTKGFRELPATWTPTPTQTPTMTPEPPTPTATYLSIGSDATAILTPPGDQ